MKTIYLIIFIPILFVILSFCSCKNKDSVGTIGIEYIASYKTNIGESKPAPAKVGILLNSVNLSFNDKKDQGELVLNVEMSNYSDFPISIGIGNKYIIDSKNRKFAIVDGTSGLLNPEANGVFEYIFNLPRSIITDTLYFAFVGYIDRRKKEKGFEIKWKIKIKDESDFLPEAGEKEGLVW